METEIISAVNQDFEEQSNGGVLPYIDRITFGDCAKLMRNLPDGCADLIVTDPPYIANYRDRGGRRIINDDNTRWIYPTFFEAYRVLKENAFCFSFYGWSKADRFLAAWRECGFRPVGHFTCLKGNSSSLGFTKMEN
jgi:adenine-specific DNA-methyltransferase